MKLIKYALSVALLLPLLSCSSSESTESKPMPKQPNILLIFSDDHQAAAINSWGNPYIQTPNLDKLVAEGTSFTETFAQTPTCVPSRAALLTGCGSLTHGSFYPKYTGSANTDLERWPQVMKDAGYDTFWTGKFNHLGSPAEWGVEHTKRVYQRGMGPHEMTFQEEGEAVSGFSSELFADALIDFISQEHDKPFFASVAFTAPHDPRTPPEEYATMYDPNEVPLPANFMSHYNYEDGYETIRDEKLLPYPRNVDAVRSELAAYYGLITHMDVQIGRIMESLKSKGLEENTVVIYASDNGLSIGHHGLLGKFSFYKHSLNVPMIIKGPSIPKNRKTDAYVYLHDLFPTFCEMTGITIPETVESKSFLPVLMGGEKSAHDYMFGALSNRKRSVTTENFRLVRHYHDEKKAWGTDEYLFFDLRKDPLEIVNQIDNPEYASEIARMKEVLKKHQEQHNDFLPAAY